MTISFEGRVAMVTGAGGGLGAAYARALAARGARVLVNDMSADAAAAVVDAIVADGGVAMTGAGSVTDEAAIERAVANAVREWGGVDILINNAGILRDKSFAKMSIEDWRLVVEVHLTGSAIATRAVWETMRARSYGRILMTASSTGLYGNFGQANYGAAKMGLAGLTKSLYLEGAKYGIRVNTIAPVAGTGMTQHVMPEDRFDNFAPERVVPAALYLVSEEAPTNVILGAGGGMVHAAYVTMTKGVWLPEDELTPEGVAARWNQIVDRTGEIVPDSGGDQIRAMGTGLPR